MRAVAALEMRVPAFALRYNTLYERTGIHSDHRVTTPTSTRWCGAFAPQRVRLHAGLLGSEGRLLLSGSEPFDLVITDLHAAGMAGEDVVRLVRARGDMPVIVMSARTTAADKVALLKLGADDYLTKPFDLDELLARVQVQLAPRRRSPRIRVRTASDERLPEPAAATAMRYKDWTLDVDARTLSVQGEPVRLTRLEFNILEALVRRPRKVFTKRELFEIAWNEESAVEEKAINVHVSNIRSKLRAAHSAGEIETVWGIGFKLAE